VVTAWCYLYGRKERQENEGRIQKKQKVSVETTNWDVSSTTGISSTTNVSTGDLEESCISFIFEAHEEIYYSHV
jgi:hypothetical protein